MSSRILKMFALVACCFGLLDLGRVEAQFKPTPEMHAAAGQQFASTLDKVDGLLYKRETLDDGLSRFQAAFENDGSVTKFTILIRYVGYFAKKPLYTAMFYAPVVDNANPLPPPVIKLVAVKSDNTSIGGLVMSEDYKRVYVTSKMPCDTLTEGQVWITLALLHDFKSAIKKEIEDVLAAAPGR
jgi:hypothetical protein